MKSTDYLFPRDLVLTETPVKKVFVVGSCMTEALLEDFKVLQPETEFDYITVNNLMCLPDMAPEQAAAYQLQYIQIPLRTVIGDNIIRIVDFEKNASFDDIEQQAKGMLSAVLSHVMKHNKAHGLLTLVSNFMVPQSNLAPSLSERGGRRDFGRLVRAMNDHLDQVLATEYKNAYVADFEGLVSSMGKRAFLDDAVSFYAHAGMFCADVDDLDNYPSWLGRSQARIELVNDVQQTYGLRPREFSELVLAQMTSIYRIATQVDTVKIVIFDLDNTLWRGQIAEHYEIGQEWPVSHLWPVGLWEAIHHLRRRGIMVSLSSKNDEHIVRERWSRAVLPWLGYDDFLLPKINWRPKSQNIQETLDALSLTAKGAVFVDDNPVERDEVRRNIPGIRVIGADPYQTRRILLWSAETQRPSSNAETAGREQSYRNIVARESEKQQSGSREDFLAGLGVHIDFTLVANVHSEIFQRVSELINKTNQFNTTGLRWSGADFAAFFDQGGQIYAFSVRDKFSEYGVVGAILVNAGVVRQFTMSCRVLGMDVEIGALRHLADQLFAAGLPLLVGAVVDTELNTPCRDVFQRCGFVAAGQPGVYTLVAAAPRVATPHITIVDAPVPVTPSAG